MKIKICGIQTLSDVEIINKFQPDYIGFIFASSSRQISLEQAKILKNQLMPNIKTVGVFVNETVETMITYEAAGVIDAIQLHGDENIQDIIKLKLVSQLPIIKALRIGGQKKLQCYDSLLTRREIDYILLDTYMPKAYGGTGACFDWHLLSEMNRPYFLAGGIGSDNIEDTLTYHPYALDISSKVEVAGHKDFDKIKILFEKLEKYR